MTATILAGAAIAALYWLAYGQRARVTACGQRWRDHSDCRHSCDRTPMAHRGRHHCGDCGATWCGKSPRVLAQAARQTARRQAHR